MNSANELTQILKIKYPIVQAPMLGVSTPAMVAAVSEAGGLGSLPVGGLPPQKTLSLIRETKKLTSKPFAVNLFAHDNKVADEQLVIAMQDLLATVCAQNALSPGDWPALPFPFYSYKEQVSILIDEKVPVVSFTFGILDDDSIASLKKNRVTLVGTATCLQEARLLDKKGIDIIAAQGIEAGGHRGTFLEDIPLPQIGVMELVKEIAAHLHKPILAAGGINNAEAMQAAFTAGAGGIQIGTAFIPGDESAAAPSYKLSVQDVGETGTQLTRAFSGRWARTIPNKFVTAIESAGKEIPPYPVQAALTAGIRVIAQQQDNKDFIALFSGQSGSGGQCRPVAEIFNYLVSQLKSLSIERSNR